MQAWLPKRWHHQDKGQSIMETTKRVVVIALAAAVAFLSVAPLTPKVFAQEGCDPDALVPVRFGQRGAAVRNAQECLITLGHDIPAGATGYYGSQTVAAVKAHYREHLDMAWHGRNLGPKGIQAMKDGLAGQPPATTPGQQQALESLLKTLGLTDAQIAAILALVGKTPTPPTQPGQPGQPVPLTGVVSVEPGVNVGGSIISGAAQIPVLNFKVKNGTNQEVMVTAAKFTKRGVVSDANISNAYLSIGNNIVAQYVGLTQGVLQFSGNLFSVPAGQAVDVSLRVDLSSGTENGNTISFDLVSANDLTLNQGTVSGTFPIQGGIYTSTKVSNPGLASLASVSYQTVANEVDAGTTGFRASSLSFTVQNSPVKLMSVRYTISGSVNYSDLRNPVLKLDGVQIATGTVSPDGKVFFDMSANPPVMNTGTHVLDGYIDPSGSPNREMTWQIQRPSDWVLVDTQYNTNISGGTPSGTATKVSIKQGRLTISLDPSTPTGNVPLGSTNFTVAKFTVRASGEAVKIKWLPFKLTQAGSSGAWSTVANVDADVRNISLFADDGTQLGTTINTPSSCTYGTPEVTTTTYICSFGSPTSNINYIVPANTTRVFSLRVDIQSAADITSLKGSLVAPSGTSGFIGSNIEGQISFQTDAAPGGTIDGSNLTVVSSPFIGSVNSALSTQKFVGGAYNAKIASFSLGASSAEGIKLTSVTLKTSANVNSGIDPELRLQNLTAKIGNTTLNYTVPTLSASTNYTFSVPGEAMLIPAGGNVIVDVYADILQNSSTTTFTAPIALTGAVGMGANTNTNQTLKTSGGAAITNSAPLNGQNLQIGGSGALTVNGVSNDPVQSQWVKGATGVVLAKFQLRETSNNEGVRVVDLTVTASSTNSTASASPWSNLRLVDSNGADIPGAGPLSLSVTNGKGTVKFSPTNFIVPANSTVVVGLKADVSNDETFFANNNGTTWVFNIAASSDVNAVGQASTNAITVSGTGSGTNSTNQTAMASKLSLLSFAKLPGVIINNSSDLKLANVTFRADGASGNFGVLKQLKVTFSGPALTTTATKTATVYLRNPGDTIIATTSISFSSTSASAVATLNVATNTTEGYVFVGTDKTFTLSVDTNDFVTPSQSNQNPIVSMQIGAGSVLTDVTYATYVGQPNFTESFNLDRQAPNSPLPKTVVVGYQSM